MSFTPIVERELRLLSRRPPVYWMRTIAVTAAVLVGFGCAYAGVATNGATATMGRFLFQGIALLSFTAAIISGPLLTADCLSEEKRNGTLGLLFLSGLTGRDVVAGKLVAMSLPAAQCLVGILPILGFSFLLGGVTGEEFARVIIVLLLTLLLSLTSAMAVSSVSRQGTRALGASVILLVAIFAGLPALQFLPASHGWLHSSAMLSPTFALQLVSDLTYPSNPAGFSSSCGAGLLMSLLFFVIASLCVPFSWRDKPVQPGLAERWFFRRAAKSLKPARPRRYRRLLDSDPLVWVATRKQTSIFAVWLIVAIAIVICGWAWVSKPSDKGQLFVVVCYATHALLKILIAWDASRRFTDERTSGALELLLCTPLEARGIWRSWLVGLKRTYFLPIVILTVAELIVWFGGLNQDGWWDDDGILGTAFAAGTLMFLLDSYAISWMGVWQGLSARNSLRACFNTTVIVLGAPAVMTLGLFGLIGILQGAGVPFGLLLTSWFVVGCAADMTACGYSMLRFTEQFRAVIAQAAIPGEKQQTWRLSSNTPGVKAKSASLASASPT